MSNWRPLYFQRFHKISKGFPLRFKGFKGLPLVTKYWEMLKYVKGFVLDFDAVPLILTAVPLVTEGFSKDVTGIALDSHTKSFGFSHEVL